MVQYIPPQIEAVDRARNHFNVTPIVTTLAQDTPRQVNETYGTYVNAWFSAGVGAQGTMFLEVSADGSTGWEIWDVAAAETSTASAFLGASALLPPGYYYRVSGTGSTTVNIREVPLAAG